MKRLFIGIGFTEDLPLALAPWMKKLRRLSDEKEISVKWSPPENYHVTLVFLGETEDSQIPNICRAMDRVAQKTAPFSLKLDTIDAFPEISHGRAIYLKVQRSQKLLDLHSDLERELQRETDFGYSPHLTLGRLRNPRNCRDFLSPVKDVNLGKHHVNAFTLFESIQTGPFSVYKAMCESRLSAELSL